MNAHAPKPALIPFKPSAQAMGAKAELIRCLESISDADYNRALEALQGRWMNGMKQGLEKGFQDGWNQACDQLEQPRARPDFKVELPASYEPPAWPDTMGESGVLDFVACLMSIQVSRRGGGGKDCGEVIHAQWAALDRAYAFANRAGKEEGKKSGLSARHCATMTEH